MRNVAAARHASFIYLQDPALLSLEFGPSGRVSSLFRRAWKHHRPVGIPAIKTTLGLVTRQIHFPR